MAASAAEQRADRLEDRVQQLEGEADAPASPVDESDLSLLRSEVLTLPLDVTNEIPQTWWRFISWQRGTDVEADMYLTTGPDLLNPSNAEATTIEQSDLQDSRPCASATTYSKTPINLSQGQLICLRRDVETLSLLRVDRLPMATEAAPTFVFEVHVWSLQAP